jgi:hypothetical protein
VNRLRSLLHRHRWVTVTLGIDAYKTGGPIVTIDGCPCGEHRLATKNYQPHNRATQGE